MASFIPTVTVNGMPYGGGTAATSAGGSAMGFNALTSAGGLGSGSAKGSTNSVIDGYDGATTNVDGVATATFTGNGLGTDGNIPNQPYAGGSVKGSGSGTGTADIAGVNEDAISAGVLLMTNGDAAFNSNGGGSGFVNTPFGGAAGSAFGGVSGSAAEQTGGGDAVVYGDLTGSGSSSASAVGIFDGGFSPAGSSGLTGGSGSGNGSVDVAGTTSQNALMAGGSTYGDALGSGTATSAGGGAATGFNAFGEAGGLGSGSTTGSAAGALDSYIGFSAEGNGAAAGVFNAAGSGSFGAPQALTFP
jgi:hypothetical protein